MTPISDTITKGVKMSRTYRKPYRIATKSLKSTIDETFDYFKKIELYYLKHNFYYGKMIEKGINSFIEETIENYNKDQRDGFTRTEHEYIHSRKSKQRGSDKHKREWKHFEYLIKKDLYDDVSYPVETSLEWWDYY